MSFVFLYLEFFQIGLFAIGGGLATLPFLHLMANNGGAFIRETGWLSTEQVGNFIAIAQCAPGAVGVNVAAQTGFLYGGIGGGIFAVLGLISPAVIIISVVSRALQSMKKNKTVTAVFSGLRPAATGLLSAAGWGVWRLTLYNAGAAEAGMSWREIFRWRESLICAALFLLIVKFKLHPVIYVAIGAAAGIAFGL